MKEYILCAAICNSEEVDMTGEPLVYCGHRHHNILHQSDQVSRVMCHQGFLTNTGRFVSRKEAYKIAYEADQIIGPNKGRSENRLGLTSEDLY